ncbi:hypothetical protein [Plebeiibacterium sediminum]|uniref:Uncharacterized protein n=1 Tax=Plebeiibacterium sediminum TaxID=2992112 RepID=A0AAE3M0K7_9BACT|nr:hypothetical protein [Plebeiobacterium sediminum]MCW3784874.1 hypothetical protein [Plebeiobacterium sediminum]
MSQLRKVLYTIFFWGVFASVNCQSTKTLKLITDKEDYKINEKVLLIPDQEMYLSGESINFQAITFDATLLIPIDFSSVLYLELYDQDYHVVSAKKYLLQKGKTINSIIIPRHLSTDYYYLRAYTNYMKNFGPASFFTKQIKVVNPFLPKTQSAKDNKDSTSMKLNVFAEGGKLIYGIKNKIVVSCQNCDKKVDLKLLRNDSVVMSKVMQNGFNAFTFTPNPLYNYQIVATSINNQQSTIPLKKIADSGLICRLDSINKNSAFLKLYSKEFNDYPLNLFVENNGFKYEYTQPIHQQDSCLAIKLPTGLNTVIIKDQSLNTVTQRNIYIEPNPHFNISAELNKSNTTPGDSVILNINSDINDSINYYVSLKLGNSQTSTPSDHDIIHSVFLSSSIASISNHISANDINLMNNEIKNINDYILTFPKNKSFSYTSNTINFLPEISNDIVTGNISSKDERSYAANKNIYLSFVDSISWINRCSTDSLGHFTCKLPLLYQGNDLIISMTDTISSYQISLDNEFYPDFLNITKELFTPDSTLKAIIEARMLNLQINDAYNNPKESIDVTRQNLRFYGDPEQEYLFRNYLNLPSFKEYIYEIVDRATPKTKKQKTSIALIDDEGNYGINPFVILDGIPIFNIQELLSIPCTKFKSLRVVSNPFFFGPNSYDGIIDITSNNISFDLIKSEKNSERISFCPTITTSLTKTYSDKHIPNYASNLHFNKTWAGNINKQVSPHLPHNSGSYTVFIWGYTNDGKWSCLLRENFLEIESHNQ